MLAWPADARSFWMGRSAELEIGGMPRGSAELRALVDLGRSGYLPEGTSPYPWRGIAAGWPIELRVRFGELANARAEGGVGFPEDEASAFCELVAEGAPVNARPPAHRRPAEDFNPWADSEPATVTPAELRAAIESSTAARTKAREVDSK